MFLCIQSLSRDLFWGLRPGRNPIPDPWYQTDNLLISLRLCGSPNPVWQTQIKQKLHMLSIVCLLACTTTNDSYLNLKNHFSPSPAVDKNKPGMSREGERSKEECCLHVCFHISPHELWWLSLIQQCCFDWGLQRMFHSLDLWFTGVSFAAVDNLHLHTFYSMCIHTFQSEYLFGVAQVRHYTCITAPR